MFTSYLLRVAAVTLSVYLFSIPAISQDLIINELYADPNPKGSVVPAQQVFPTESGAEFIEIHNREPYPVLCSGYELSGKAVPEFSIDPGAFVILCPAAYAASYESFGQVVGLNSWNALSNGGERVYLTDALGNTIDEVTYSSSWHSGGKDRGGWSLERVNPVLNCSGPLNWASSLSDSGASPGTDNSTVDYTPDAISPELLNSEWQVQDSLRLYFSENIYTEQVSVSTKPYLDVLPRVSENELILQVMSQPVPGQVYSFVIDGITDCEGNSAGSISIDLSPDLSPPVLESFSIISSNAISLKFNEPLDNQAVYNGAVYSYNCGIEVQNIYLVPDKPEQLTLESDRPFTEGESCALTLTNIKDRSGNAASIEVSFSYLPAIDTAFTEESGIVRVRYKELPDNALSVENYELPSLGLKPFIVLPDSDHPSDVRLVFSPVPPPDQHYILAISDMISDGQFLVTPHQDITWDTRPPVLDSYSFLSPDTVILNFNEALDKDLATISAHFELNDGSAPCRIQLPDPQTILLIYCEPLQQEHAYRMRIHSLADRYGNVMTRSKYFDLLFDNKPPEVLRAQLLSPSAISFVFSERMDEPLHPENLLLPPTYPPLDSLSHYFKESGDSVIARFAGDLPEGILALNIAGVSDLQGNVATDTISVEIDHTHPAVGFIQAISDTSLIISFTHAFHPGTTDEMMALINNEPVPFSLNDQSSMTLLPAAPIQPGHSAVEVRNVRYDEQSFDFTGQVDYRRAAYGISMVGPNMLKVYWKDDVEVPSNAALFSVTGQKPLLVWDDPEEGVSNVLLAESVEENTMVSLTITAFSTADGEYWPYARYEAFFDRKSPGINGLSARSENEILLSFSEPLDYASASSPYRYQINDDWPQNSRLVEDSIVAIRPMVSLANDSEYHVYISGIRDKAGNVMSDTTLAFIYKAPSRISQGDLVLSELLPEPSDEAAPAQEFVELLNTSDDTLIVKGLTLSDRTSSGKMEGFNLAPNEHLIMTAGPSVAYYSSFGKAVAVSPWPSLNNSDDDLFLVNEEGDTIASLYYQTGSLAAGQSLERVDVLSSCSGALNWQPAIAIEGHTAGARNSVMGVVSDSLPPKIRAAYLTSAGSCTVWMDEPLAGSLYASGLSILTSDNTPVHVTTVREISPLRYEVIFAVPLNLSSTYRLVVNDLTDCAGNTSGEVRIDQVIYPQKAEFGDIILTEILFNPPPGGVDFIECYNTTEKYISVSDLYFFSNDREVRIESDLPVVIAPHQYLAFTPDPAQLKTQYPSADLSRLIKQPLPSLPDDQGQIGLKSPADSVWQIFDYQDRYHHPLIRSAEGVSLERISLQEPVNDPDNWTSAAADAGYGSPGEVNSQYLESQRSAEGSIQLSTHLITPNYDGVDDFVMIRYSFKMGENIANAWIYDIHGRRIATLSEGAVASASGHLRWDGVSDRGQLVSTGYYLIVIESFNSKTGRKRIREKVAVSRM